MFVTGSKTTHDVFKEKEEATDFAAEQFRAQSAHRV